MQIDIILFDGFDELDAIGPYETLRTAAALGADVDAELVGAHGAATITADHGLAAVRTADTVVIPGIEETGGTPSPAVLAALRAADRRGARMI